MESKTKKILAIGLSGIVITSIILIVVFLPRPQESPGISFSASIPDLTIDASKPASNRTINISNYVTPELPNSQISISTNYTSAPWNSRISIMGTNLTFQTFNFPTNGYYSIKITVTYQGVSINDEVKILLTGKNTWTWVSGNYSHNNFGTYGTKGVADAANLPGARYASASRIDTASNFWLFGGYGFDNGSVSAGQLNDLWMFDVSDATWTWMSGNDTRSIPGIYGTQGVADPDNMPGARDSSASWMDFNSNFWLFGGDGLGNFSSGELNDLWMFNVTTSTWTWVSGNYSANNNGTYGMQGVADEENVPGARHDSASWTDASGNLWLFGGVGFDNASNIGSLNDLWRFNVTTTKWTWVSGNYSVDNKGTYGTKGVADADNVPGARFASASWTDADGNLWLFGGVGFDNASNIGSLNDLWMFNVTTSTWTWVSGNDTRSIPGIYGTQGVADPANAPGSRRGSVPVTDAGSNLWLFGGVGFDNASNFGYLNDLWMFNLTDATWTWVSGNYSNNNLGRYGTKGVVDAANVPGGRCYSSSYIDTNGNFWLFGGLGCDNVSVSDQYLNDLWKYTP
ncbi:MAG: galactose oxidase [Candidatus Lokiarchaeota archaeon]|nr:galactose oxidase [Candidatus Lokiarchaeota archaeon]